MQTLLGQHILLGISGGIASYKSAILARRLIDAGAGVRVVMTTGAQAFVTPLTFQALTGNAVHTDLLDPTAEAAMGHIELARWADHIVIAPVTANLLARLSHGLADDLLTTLCLASDASLFLAPAMNRLMWQHPATASNVQLLVKRGAIVLGPASGAQACGESGEGRMLEPEAIRDLLIEYLQTNTLPRLTAHQTAELEPPKASANAANQLHTNDSTHPALNGKNILITAGPTVEPIDPVRFISNRSSGKMGFALAASAIQLGARVTLICGPVNLDTPSQVNRIDVTTAASMHHAVMAAVDDADVFIGVAAVADYRVEHVAAEKIKKHKDSMTLSLVRNPDILKDVAALPTAPFCVGFAAETESVESNARAKLNRKKLDMIAANHVAQPGNPVFGEDSNTLEVYWEREGHRSIPVASKSDVAASLLKIIAERLHARESSSPQ